MTSHLPSRLPSHAVRRAAASVAVLGLLGFSTAAFADDATPPSTDELREQIRRLQEQVERLEARAAGDSAATPPTTRPAATERALADAEARNQRSILAPLSLSQDGEEPFVAGHNGKFLLSSPEGDFTLNPNVQLQIRNVTNINNEDGESFEDVENGWEIRRTKVGFKGNAFGKDLNYDIKFAFERDGGGAVLENAFVDYMPERFLGQEGMGLRAGQFKDATFHEETISSSKQTAVDRSLVNESIGGGNTDFIQGAGPIWEGEKWQAILLYTDGAGSANTNYRDGDWDYGFAGRADVILAGDGDAVLDDFSALDTEENSARVGAGFHFAAEGDTRVLWHGVDGQFETARGLGLFAGYYGRMAESDGEEVFDMGGMLQVSQAIGENGWEAFGRYDFVMFEDEIVLGTDAEDFFHEITFGVNKYWKGHKLKMTIDAVYLPNGNPGSNSGIGLRPSGGEFDDQVSIRGQFQLLL